jgi:hypothetical protein
MCWPCSDHQPRPQNAINSQNRACYKLEPGDEAGMYPLSLVSIRSLAVFRGPWSHLERPITTEWNRKRQCRWDRTNLKRNKTIGNDTILPIILPVFQDYSKDPERQVATANDLMETRLQHDEHCVKNFLTILYAKKRTPSLRMQGNNSASTILYKTYTITSYINLMLHRAIPYLKSCLSNNIKLCFLSFTKLVEIWNQV